MKWKLLLLLTLSLANCSTLKQDTKNVDKAAVRHPEILANKARILFPCVTTKGDTIYVSDSAAYMDALNELQDTSFSLYHRNDSLLKQLDSIQKDSSCFQLVDIYTQVIQNKTKEYNALLEKSKHIPPIIKTITIHDTTIDNASVAACEFHKNQLIAVIKPLTDDRDRLKKGRNIWRLIALISLAVNGLGLYFKIAGIFKPKIKA